ncbi:hypothetical protein L226DRAFT_320761 [Lentinus tigrinus ALCF2SS1-7]|uniref:uncharacterized protein n=1 Tax=Lentinus tigrinus ALCF2SS1-7 TaxID=1328758 RepID=UPI0011662835|nr:hypothetical protein L226DRAFT_320761 [Lentinus tigrinus ALCF2SS1-7]
MIVHGQRSLSASRPISPTDDHRGRHRGSRGPEPSTEAPVRQVHFHLCETLYRAWPCLPCPHLPIRNGIGIETRSLWLYALLGVGAPPLCRHRSCVHSRVVVTAASPRGWGQTRQTWFARQAIL